MEHFYGAIFYNADTGEKVYEADAVDDDTNDDVLIVTLGADGTFTIHDPS